MANDTWYLRAWQRALRDFFIMATKEASNETVFFTTDNTSYINRVGMHDPVPDLRLLLSVPTAKIRPSVRAEIRSMLTESPDPYCQGFCDPGECLACENVWAAKKSAESKA